MAKNNAIELGAPDFVVVTMRNRKSVVKFLLKLSYNIRQLPTEITSPHVLYEVEATDDPEIVEMVLPLIAEKLSGIYSGRGYPHLVIVYSDDKLAVYNWHEEDTIPLPYIDED